LQLVAYLGRLENIPVHGPRGEGRNVEKKALEIYLHVPYE